MSEVINEDISAFLMTGKKSVNPYRFIAYINAKCCAGAIRHSPFRPARGLTDTALPE